VNGKCIKEGILNKGVVYGKEIAEANRQHNRRVELV